MLQSIENVDVAQRRLTILGSTGSIGQSTIDIVRHHREQFPVEALVANTNIKQLAADARALGASIAVTADESRYDELKDLLAGSGVEAAAGQQAVIDAASRPADMVMAAIVGAGGLQPTLAAASQGTTIALANKECLVCAGELFIRDANGAGASVIPVDSEHSAIFQCFEARNAAQVHKVTLTASGGPFRARSLSQLQEVSPEEALKHPNWSMGPKVTIDSATLMNKGLELIEAYHLFPVSVDQLGAVIHPQSIVHSMVSYVDGSVLAQLGVPDMRTPIACAMAWPGRVHSPVESLDLVAVGQLTFEAIDSKRFPAIDMCLGALRCGGSATAILNAANEIAVAEFLSQSIGFVAITTLVECALSRAERDNMLGALGSLEDVWEADAYGRRIAVELAREMRP